MVKQGGAVQIEKGRLDPKNVVNKHFLKFWKVVNRTLVRVFNGKAVFNRLKFS